MSPSATLPAYDQGTTSAQVDLEAHPCGGSPGSPALATMNRWSKPWPCARVDAEWVPQREALLVPAPLMTTCRSCPLRQACLAGAIARGEHGYWAGTTTADRRAMLTTGRTCIAEADAQQHSAAQHLTSRLVAPSHAPGSAGYRGYRGGCRCPRCRAGNAAARAAKRRRARMGACA